MRRRDHHVVKEDLHFVISEWSRMIISYMSDGQTRVLTKDLLCWPQRIFTQLSPHSKVLGAPDVSSNYWQRTQPVKCFFRGSRWGQRTKNIKGWWRCSYYFHSLDHVTQMSKHVSAFEVLLWFGIAITSSIFKLSAATQSWLSEFDTQNSGLQTTLTYKTIT